MGLKEAIFVKRSKKRKAILEKIKEKSINPSTVAKALGDHLSTISRSFKDLQKAGLIECINPKEKNFRIYKITEKGKRALKEAEKL